MIERYGEEKFIRAARKLAVHECFARVFTIDERAAIEAELSKD